jgi:hypothetical protein
MDTARRRFGGARACGARYFLNSRLAGGSRRGAVDRWMGRVGVVPAASAALPAAPAPALEWVEPAEASFEGPNGPAAVLSHPRPGAMREVHERGTDHELSRDVLAAGGRDGRRVLLVVIEEAALERPRALLHLLHLPRGLSPPEPRHGWPRVRLHLPDAAPGLEEARPFRCHLPQSTLAKDDRLGVVPNPIRISMTRYLCRRSLFMVNQISNYFLLSSKPPSSSSWSSARTSLSHTSANGFTGSTLNGSSI